LDSAAEFVEVTCPETIGVSVFPNTCILEFSFKNWFGLSSALVADGTKEKRNIDKNATNKGNFILKI
jgi:hypothetical protein